MKIRLVSQIGFIIGVLLLIISIFLPFFQVGPYDVKGYKLESITYLYIGIILSLLSIFMEKVRLLKISLILKIFSILSITMPLINILIILLDTPGTIGGWSLDVAVGTFIYSLGYFSSCLFTALLAIFLPPPPKIGYVDEFTSRLEKLEELYKEGRVSERAYQLLKKLYLKELYEKLEELYKEGRISKETYQLLKKQYQ